VSSVRSPVTKVGCPTAPRVRAAGDLRTCKPGDARAVSDFAMIAGVTFDDALSALVSLVGHGSTLRSSTG
jgi:hypothetical protein